MESRRTITAEKIGDLAVKLANASLVASDRGDDVHALFFATKAAECLALAKALGWKTLMGNKDDRP